MTSIDTDEVRHLLASDQVYDVVAGRIFRGELPAGARLRIRDLAEQVGTSVMPVREAIQQLVKNGLAVSEPHRGARVREFTTRELIDIYDARSVLEIEAVRRAAERVTPADLAAMRAACERMYRAVVHARVDDALDEDEKLLRIVYSAADNPVVMNLIELLWTQCRAYKVMGATAAIERHDPSLWEPQPALIEALARGDVDQVTAITHDSIAAARTRLEAALAS
jgi:DNA-binding GntR family transcriptional regulator